MENVKSYDKHNLREIEGRIMKRPRSNVNINKLRAGLHVKIDSAEGIDDPNLHPSVVNRFYCVLYWVEPGEEFYTNLTNSLPNPVWKHSKAIPIGKNPDNYEFLNVEVLRLCSQNDPGTSNGMALVGRTRIPLPKEFNVEKGGRFGLVRAKPEGDGYKAEGHIVLSMELKWFRI